MNRDLYGFSLSFFMHAAILAAFIYLLPALDLQPKPLVIDFTLIPGKSSPAVKKESPKVQEPAKPAQIVQAVPEPKQLVSPKSIKKAVLKTQQKPVAAKKITRPAEKMLPRKEEKKVEEMQLPEVAGTVSHTEDVAETFKVQPQNLQQNTGPQVQAANAPLAFSRPSRQEMESQYVKAHFTYIKKIIEKNIVYPPIARRMGWQGKVVVSFIVCENGRVEDLHIIESSGRPQLDRNAIETVREVEPFPSPPVRVKLVLPVTYRIS